MFRNSIQLAITGAHGHPIENVFHRQERGSQRLAIIFPGLLYPASAPLLYYSARLLDQLGMDVLQLTNLYGTIPEFLQASEDQQLAWIDTDTDRIWEAVQGLGAYEEIVLLGKSLGTFQLGRLVEVAPRLRSTPAIWMTPGLSSQRLRDQICLTRQCGLIIIGTEDHYYDARVLESLEEATGNPSLVIPDADHSLEIPGQVHPSLQVLLTVVEAIEAFLTTR